MKRSASLLALTAAIAAPVSLAHAEEAFSVTGSAGTELRLTAYDGFAQPWAMTFLPDGRLLVSEKVGNLVLVSADGRKLGEIDGVPAVIPQGQGGLGDIVLHPDYAENGLVYLSYVERDESDVALSGAVVIRAKLDLTADDGALSEIERIWEQTPKVTGNGHYSHRIAFAPDGHLFITSGDRQKLDPAQEMDVNLGKIIRLTEDGSVPEGNPFADGGGISEQFWSVGHRNPLGIHFDASGQLWSHEMGPRGGDEINRIEPASNYGWPRVSDGRHYSGLPIPDHETDPSFAAPAISWVPSISPAGFVIYDGDVFPDWQGQAILGGLSSEAVIRVVLGDPAEEAERYSWSRRIREIEQGPDGRIWVLEDGEGGRLVSLEPAA